VRTPLDVLRKHYGRYMTSDQLAKMQTPERVAGSRDEERAGQAAASL